MIWHALSITVKESLLELKVFEFYTTKYRKLHIANNNGTLRLLVDFSSNNLNVSLR